MYFPAQALSGLITFESLGHTYIHTIQGYSSRFPADLLLFSKPFLNLSWLGRFAGSVSKFSSSLVKLFFLLKWPCVPRPHLPNDYIHIVLSSTQCQGDIRIVLVQIVELDGRVWPKSQEGGQSHQEMFTLPYPTVELGLIRHFLRVFQHHPLTTSRILRAILYHHTYMHMYP